MGSFQLRIRARPFERKNTAILASIEETAEDGFRVAAKPPGTGFHGYWTIRIGYS